MSFMSVDSKGCQDKLLLADLIRMVTGTELTVQTCGCTVQALHWFEHNQPVVDSSGLSARDYAAEAKALACSLLEEQCGTVALFLTEMAQVGGLRQRPLATLVHIMARVM